MVTKSSSVFASVGGPGCYKNGDLWCSIGVALERKRRVTVYKVRAHVLAPGSPHELAAHTWTSVVGNELADAFAEKGALLHEVPVDGVKTSWEADSLVVRIQKQLRPCKPFLNSRAWRRRWSASPSTTFGCFTSSLVP